MLDIYAASVREELSVPSDEPNEQPKYDRKFTIEVFNEARPYYEIVSVMEKEEPTANEQKLE